MEHFYYTGMPLVSDEVYDHKYRVLQDLEARHRDYLDLSMSPTQTVGSNKGTVPHVTPMLSIQNCWDDKQFMAFIKRVGQDTELVAEPKYDGVAISLTYDKGQLIQALTRGDGYMGESVLRVAKTITSIPTTLPLADTLIIRGELLIHDEDFRQFNLNHKFANPRNLVAGALRQLGEINYNCASLTKLYPYCIEEGPNFTHMEDLALLKSLGFQLHPDILLTKDVTAMLSYYKQKVQHTDPFASDGVVYKVNNHALRIALGNSAKHPRASIAYKFPSKSTTAVIVSIHSSMGRTGVITPIAEIEPVYLDGVKITRSSLFNFNYVADNNIKVGSQVILKRAGGVIPYILDSIDLQPHIKAVIPQYCPGCDSLLLEEKKTLKCCNTDCREIVAQCIVWRASKSIFNIVGCDISTIQELQRTNLIKDFFDLYRLRYEDLIKLRGFSSRKARNLLNSIALRSEVSLVQAIMFLTIPRIGRAGALALARKLTKLADLLTLEISALQDIAGFGTNTCETIRSYLALPHVQTLIQDIEKHVRVS